MRSDEEVLTTSTDRAHETMASSSSCIYEEDEDDTASDDNILLCWDDHVMSLQELVKTTSTYEKNMLEYYRYT